MVCLTAEGVAKLEQEMEYLKTVRMAEISEDIKEARSHGDLSENAEYDAAKNEQARVDNRITEIEQILRDVVIIDEDSLNTSTVNIGSTVCIKNVDSKQEYEFHIVGAAEADFADGKISYDSPIGAALIGAKKGKTVEVVAPAGTVRYKITDIKK